MDNLLIHPKDTYCVKKDTFLHGKVKCEVYNKYTGKLLTVMSYEEYTYILGASLNTAGYLNLKIDDKKEGETAIHECCDYCEGKPLIIRNDEFSDTLRIVNIKENNLKLTIEGEGTTEEEINYCPKCGRKLKGEE